MRLPLLVLLLAAPGLALAQSADALLDFGWLSEEQRGRSEQAHTALEEAEAEMCSTMIDLYAEHASRVHGEGDGEGLAEEEIAFFKRRCEAEAFADHVAQSIDLHEAVQRETHAGGHGD
ncbi:MAG: hypothetical protein ACFBWO_01820 [Paracoccaceae bacterium]